MVGILWIYSWLSSYQELRIVLRILKEQLAPQSFMKFEIQDLKK